MLANSSFSPVTGYDDVGEPLDLSLLALVPLTLSYLEPLAPLTSYLTHHTSHLTPHTSPSRTGVGKPLDLFGHRRSSTRLLHQVTHTP